MDWNGLSGAADGLGASAEGADMVLRLTSDLGAVGLAVLAVPAGFLMATGDPLSGAGWVGSGLLGAVLAWLLGKHIPDKDKQLERILTEKEASLRQIIEITQRRHEENIRQHQITQEDIKDTRHLIRGLAHAVALSNEIVKRHIGIDAESWERAKEDSGIGKAKAKPRPPPAPEQSP